MALIHDETNSGLYAFLIKCAPYCRVDGLKV